MKPVTLLVNVLKWSFLGTAAAFALLFAVVFFMVNEAAKGPKNYGWLEHVDLPAGTDTATGLALSKCAIDKVDLTKVRAEISRKNPGLPKEWVQDLELRTMDWSQVMDARRAGVSIEITMPSDEASHTKKPAPFASTLVPLVKEKLGECRP